MAPKNNKDSLELIAQAIVRIDATLEFQAKQLEEHIRRTNVLEQEVIPLVALKNKVLGGLVVFAATTTILSVLTYLNK